MSIVTPIKLKNSIKKKKITIIDVLQVNILQIVKYFEC